MSKQQITVGYRKWSAMIRACYDPKHTTFKHLGARSVSVCWEWRKRGKGFAQFIADLGEPLEGQSLARIDDSLGFCLSNCYWKVGVKPGPKPDPTSVRQRALAAGFTPAAIYARQKREGWDETRCWSEKQKSRGANLGYADSEPRPGQH